MITHEEWLSQNPLKKFLSETGRSQTWMASYLGVSPYSIYLYLQGIHTPRRHWDKLILLTEDKSFVIKWEDWLQLREEGKIDFINQQSHARVD